MTLTLIDGDELRLWPGVAPGSEAVTLNEVTVARDDGTGQPDRIWQHTLNPALTVLKPERPNGASVILVPGGGYKWVVVDKEGFDIGRRLTAAGYTVFVLKYRLPGDGHACNADLPLIDGQRAVRLVRANAASWGLDPKRVGIFGLLRRRPSRGHGLDPLRRSGRAGGGRDRCVNARPDFAVLLYPVITMEADVTHTGSRERLLGLAPSGAAITAASLETRVSATTPPTLLVHAHDDLSVPVDNAIRYYRALRAADVPAELHVFPESGHGFALRFMKGTTKIWFDLTLGWLAETGLSPKRRPARCGLIRAPKRKRRPAGRAGRRSRLAGRAGGDPAGLGRGRASGVGGRHRRRRAGGAALGHELIELGPCPWRGADAPGSPGTRSAPPRAASGSRPCIRRRRRCRSAASRRRRSPSLMAIELLAHPVHLLLPPLGLALPTVVAGEVTESHLSAPIKKGQGRQAQRPPQNEPQDHRHGPERSAESVELRHHGHRGLHVNVKHINIARPDIRACQGRG